MWYKIVHGELSILCSDYSDIKKDKKRMEHFNSLYGVLVSYIGEENIPNPAELMGIYGRVCTRSTPIYFCLL